MGGGGRCGWRWEVWVEVGGVGGGGRCGWEVGVWVEVGGVGGGGRCGWRWEVWVEVVGVGWRSVGVVLVLCMGVADGELVWLLVDAGGCGYE